MYVIANDVIFFEIHMIMSWKHNRLGSLVLLSDEFLVINIMTYILEYFLFKVLLETHINDLRNNRPVSIVRFTEKVSTCIG